MRRRGSCSLWPHGPSFGSPSYHPTVAPPPQDQAVEADPSLRQKNSTILRQHEQIWGCPALTFASLVLDLPRTEVLSFFQHHYLRCLVIPVVIFTPRVAGRALRDRRPTGNRWPPRTVILEFRVFVAIFIRKSRDATLKFAQKCGRVLTIGETCRKLVFGWLFRSHRLGRLRLSSTYVADVITILLKARPSNWPSSHLAT
jgi:hypothetical protein